MIDNVLTQREARKDSLDHTRSIVNNTHMRTCMRELIHAGLDFVEKNPTHGGGLSFLVECLAGLQYASDDATVGKMKQIRDTFKCGQQDFAIQFLKAFAEEALSSHMYNHKHLWFQIRVRCMDAYVLSIVTNEHTHDILYYAGMAHTRILEDFLLQSGLGTPMQDDHPLVALIRPVALSNEMAHVSCVQMLSGRVLVFLGEDHTVTRLEFARELISTLKTLCFSNTPTLFLIEKHISNERDKIQRDLMCNQPNLAIHASRCDVFVEKEHEKCSSLRVQAVDNRHTDLGFMRIEIFDIWDDPAFQKAAKHFLRCSLQSIDNFCDALLQCRPINSNDGDL